MLNHLTSHKVMCMTSDLSNAPEQLGHLRMRLESLSATQTLQKVWPQVLNAVFLKLLRQIVHRARDYALLAEPRCYMEAHLLGAFLPR